MRIGKIARLPQAIQDQLNHRLENNELGEPVLAWLNELPEVREMLANLFDGVPISKQNLSQWRKGGFREWKTRQEALDSVPDIMAEMNELQPPGMEPVTDRLAPWLAIRFITNAKLTLDNAGDDKFKLIRSLCNDFVALRRSDHRLMQLKLDQERLTLTQQNREGKETESHESHPVKAGQSQSNQFFLKNTNQRPATPPQPIRHLPFVIAKGAF